MVFDSPVQFAQLLQTVLDRPRLMCKESLSNPGNNRGYFLDGSVLELRHTHGGSRYSECQTRREFEKGMYASTKRTTENRRRRKDEDQER